MLFKAGPHRNDLLARVHRHGYFPGARTQRGLQLLQHQHVARQIGELPFKVQRVFQAAQITRRVVHVGLLHFHIVQAHQGVKLNVQRLGGLAHHLLVHLAG